MTDTTAWQKSSFSGADNNQNCVELAECSGVIKVRESDTPDTVLSTTPEKLRGLILSVKADAFGRLT
ncbi:DUF397 domain-containing protein [Streptomyces sp. NPDC050617]|uniref:DUF397 domain-containing protein n=1 Tax=Streptomyces sp. NPDC050617 TaxID=3154628 RepID=UPI00342F8E46